MKVLFLEEAEWELADAVRWYERQASHLGIDFLKTVDRARNDLADNPEIWPVLDHDIRRRVLPRFPYALLYRITPDAVMILAVMHLKRQPGYWERRPER